MRPVLAAIFMVLTVAAPYPVSAGGEFVQPAFPLRVAPDADHLEDAAGRPFLIHGDTAWSLIAELTREEAELYLSDRKKRGFNALVVSLIEYKFASKAPANAYGERPFREPERFSLPNDAYFDHAEWVLRRASDLGFLVLLAPAYLGVGGGGEGWYGEMASAGPDELKAYGQYLGQRFGELHNILWLHGGDFDATDKNVVRAVVEGIASTGAGGLRTVHSAPDTVTAEYWAGEAWLDLDTVYTYGDVYGQVLARSQGATAKPVLMLESLYESEHGAGAQTVRAIAYGAMIAGAAGHVFGNNPIWHFSGPGIHHSDLSWQEALSSAGAQSMTHLRRFFEEIAWWEFAPEPDGGVLSADGEGGRLLVAEKNDRTMAIAYSTGLNAVIFDSAALGGQRVEFRWFDPANGEYHENDIVLAAKGTVRLSPPSPLNSAGDEDWLLILRVTG